MAAGLTLARTIKCDVLIVGAGGSGLRCAAEILERRPQARVLAVTKVAHCQKSHTSVAQGGLAAVDPRDPVDRPVFHMFDTWKGSDCLADQNVIQRIVDSAWEEIVWLENRGLHFSRDEEGRLARRTFGGHTLNFGQASAFRAVFEADRTGKGIVDTAWGETLKRGVQFLNQSLVTELLIKDGQCRGAVVFCQKEGELVLVLAQATILATGGSGQVFQVTTNCRQNTGDGLALILEQGLPVQDPEAVQFHPTGIIGPGILASESFRSEGGVLRNKDLEPFMERYAPKMKDLAPRDIVARAIETEIRAGRGVLNPDHGTFHVWLDIRHLPAYVHEVKLREVSGFFKKFVNVDPRTDLCPVRPSNHYHMGGIPTDQDGRVWAAEGFHIENLYAIGECASASLHGFNRLGTNSLLELITMGRFVGAAVAARLKDGPPEAPAKAGEVSLTKFRRYLEAQGKDSLGRIRETLRSLMTEKVGVFRREDGLKEAIEGIRELKARAESTALRHRSLKMNQELVQRWELDNLLAVALVMAQGALERRESRGGHFREDFPDRRPEFNKHTLARMPRFGRVDISSRPVDMSLFRAKGEHFEKFGLIERKY